MSSTDHGSTIAAKTIPAVIGTGVSFSSLPWADIAAFLTCVYVTFQIGDWIWKKWRTYKLWKAQE